MTRLVGLVVIAILLSLMMGPGLALGAEDPRFETTVNEKYLTPGDSQTVTVTILNDAEDPDDTVERATNVQAALKSADSPFTITSGPVYRGAVEDGVPRTVQFGIDVPQDVDAGSYSLPVEITYEYEGDERETTTSHIQVAISDRPRFAISFSTSDLSVQSDGSMTVTVKNIGSEPATDSTLKVESRTSVLAFEGEKSGVRSLGNLAPGDNKTVRYAMSATDIAEPDTYPVVGTVRYTDEEEVRHSAPPLATTVSVTREQTFDVRKVQSDLRVDREGTVILEVENTGPHHVENGNLKIDTKGTGLHPTQSAVAIGDLDPGENATAVYEMTVDGDTTPTARQVATKLSYEDLNGDLRSSDPTRIDVAVESDMPVFTVRGIDTRIPAGETGTVRLNVTNNELVTLSSINVKGFTNAPISITDDSAFITTLEAGESTEIALQVSAPGKSIVKDYPISVDFQYTEPDGDTKLSDTYDLPVSIIEGPNFWDTIKGFFGSVGISESILRGAALGIGLSGTGLGTIVAVKRYRR